LRAAAQDGPAARDLAHYYDIGEKPGRGCSGIAAGQNDFGSSGEMKEAR
jgi:hypothetical protein